MSTLTTQESNIATAPDRKIEYVTPRVNIRQDADAYTLEIEVPGVAKDGVDITVEDNLLTVTAQRAVVNEPGRVVHRESRGADYRRSFELDPAIDTETIGANLEQGLLTVRLAKREALKPRKIAVA